MLSFEREDDLRTVRELTQKYGAEAILGAVLSGVHLSDGQTKGTSPEYGAILIAWAKLRAMQTGAAA